MAKSRLELHEELCDFLGSRHVYFQPPESFKLVYPCIVYERTRNEDIYADNGKYLRRKAYKVTIITSNPDTDMVDRMDDMQYCRFDRSYTASNLYHFTFVLYY